MIWVNLTTNVQSYKKKKLKIKILTEWVVLMTISYNQSKFFIHMQDSLSYSHFVFFKAMYTEAIWNWTLKVVLLYMHIQ